MNYSWTFFSTVANLIGQKDEINIHNSNFLAEVLNKHKNHERIVKLKDNHTNIITFNFKLVKPGYVNKILCKLKINKATGYDNVPLKDTDLCVSQVWSPLNMFYYQSEYIIHCILKLNACIRTYIHFRFHTKMLYRDGVSQGLSHHISDVTHHLTGIIKL